MKNADVKKAFEGLINDKVLEYRERLKELKSESCTLTKNTKSMQIYKTNREIKILNLVVALLNDDVNDKAKETLISLTNPAGETNRMSVDFEAGDSFMDIAYNKYKDVKHISDKIAKVCEKKGLKLDTTTGIFVKA